MRKQLDASLLKKLGLSSLLVAILNFFRFYRPEMSLEELMLRAYGILYVSEVKWGLSSLFWLLPLFIIIFFLGEYIAKSFSQTTYIFTRTSNRSKWLVIQVFRLCCYVFYFQVLLIISTGLLGQLFNMKIYSIYDLVVIAVQEILLLSLSCALSILIVNICTLAFHPVLSSALVITMNITFLILSGALLDETTEYYKLVKWLPFTQGVYGWQLSIFNGIENFSELRIFLSSFAAIYLLFCGIIVILLGTWRIKQMDIY